MGIGRVEVGSGWCAAGTEEKNVVESVAESGVTTVTTGFMRIIFSGECRKERTCVRVMCGGRGELVWIVVVVLKSVW